MKSLPAVVIAAALAVGLSACGYTKIGRITADPTRYANRTVRVEGDVTNSFGALFAGGYQVQDETGKILVIANQGVPSKGAHVRLSGKVMNGVTISGKAYGTAIQEQGRRAW